MTAPQAADEGQAPLVESAQLQQRANKQTFGILKGGPLERLLGYFLDAQKVTAAPAKKDKKQPGPPGGRRKNRGTMKE